MPNAVADAVGEDLLEVRPDLAAALGADLAERVVARRRAVRVQPQDHARQVVVVRVRARRTGRPGCPRRTGRRTGSASGRGGRCRRPSGRSCRPGPTARRRRCGCRGAGSAGFVGWSRPPGTRGRGAASSRRSAPCRPRGSGRPGCPAAATASPAALSAPVVLSLQYRKTVPLRSKSWSSAMPSSPRSEFELTGRSSTTSGAPPSRDPLDLPGGLLEHQEVVVLEELHLHRLREPGHDRPRPRASDRRPSAPSAPPPSP